MRPKDCAYIVEHLSVRFMAMVADHSRQLAEHRAAFGARTEADRKIIAGLREESAKCQAELDDFYQREEIEQKRRMDAESERDGLLTQVQDMRAEMERLREDERKAYQAGVSLRAEVAELKTQLERLTSWAAKNQAARETLQNEIEKLKSQTPKQHPVKVGEWVKRLTGFNTTPAGEVARVTLVDDYGHSQLEYEVARPNGEKGRWSAKGCEPCDPPEADHDTVQGKATAEAALKTEPVAEEIKVGDLGEVFQATTRTLNSDVGITGRVSSVYLDPRHGGFLVTFDPSTQSRRSAGMQAFGLCDVRKVTT